MRVLASNNEDDALASNDSENADVVKVSKLADIN